MTIDERIESLRRTVELQAEMQAESGKRLEGVTQRLDVVTQRLDVVTQKLEGVTQTVELLSHMHMELAQSHAEFMKTMEEVNIVNTGILNRLERNTADHREWLGTHSLALEKQQKALEKQQKALEKQQAAHDRDMAEIRKMFKQFLRGKRSNGRS